MELRIYSTAVERTIGAMLLLVGTSLMHSLKGKTIWKMLCTFLTNIVGILGSVMSLYHKHAY